MAGNDSISFQEVSANVIIFTGFSSALENWNQIPGVFRSTMNHDTVSLQWMQCSDSRIAFQTTEMPCVTAVLLAYLFLAHEKYYIKTGLLVESRFGLHRDYSHAHFDGCHLLEVFDKFETSV